jgi:putative ABC transport system permease protein
VTPLRFALALAWRETRGSRRMLGVLTVGVALGVAALVAIRSFGASVQESVRREARGLLGADLVVSSGSPLSARAERELAALVAAARSPAGEVARLARVTRFGSMAFVPRTSGTRLVQVLAVESGYPFYGAVVSDPPDAWERLGSGGFALVDPALLVLLDARVGDELVLGEARLEIGGVVRNMPGDVGVFSALGPRVYIPASRVGETRLLTTGSRARHEAYLRMPDGVDPAPLAARYRPALAAERANLRTSDEDQQRLEAALGRLGRFLGLVGLVALLLGGLGVASAVHVLIRRRLATVAVLRCLGASARLVVLVYLLQAIGLGLAGSLAGALLGAGLGYLLPKALGGLLPVDVAFHVSGEALASGLAMGAWVAVVFALLPLVTVRRTPPLAALRRDYEDVALRSPDPARPGVAALIAASVVGLSAWQAGGPLAGAVFSAGLGAALLILWLAARLLRSAMRRLVSPRLAYPWRQGLANLYRPANQTLAVVLALGFGAFLLGTLVVLQHSLVGQLETDDPASRPNLALFDIQSDQRDGVVAVLSASGVAASPAVPIVPMRIHSLKGVAAAQILSRAAAPDAGGPQREAWMFRREFRSTYRDSVGDAETVVAGAWWPRGAGRAAGAGPVPLSLEADIARDLGVMVGDEIVWDVQGVLLPSRVASLREVRWARFEPNFFAVFPEGPLEAAPQTWVTLARVPDEALRARLQRSLVERYPNLSALDLTEVQKALDDILGRVAWAVRFMALFSVGAGLAVLLGAVAESRTERLREAVLLKTLGATRRQVLRVVAVEYASLGLLAATIGLLLALASGAALMHFAFEGAAVVPYASLAALAVAIVALTVGLGASGSLEVFRRTPLEVLRSE